MINKIILLFIKGIRPLLGPQGCCKYTITCTEYAEMQLKEKSLIPALWAIFKRVISCNPFTKVRL